MLLLFSVKVNKIELSFQHDEWRHTLFTILYEVGLLTVFMVFKVQYCTGIASEHPYCLVT